MESPSPIPPASKNKSAIFRAGILIIFIAVVAIVLSFSLYISNGTRTTDSRSKADEKSGVSVRIASSSATAVSVFLDKPSSLQDAKVSNFDVDIVISPKDQKVLGITTENLLPPSTNSLRSGFETTKEKNYVQQKFGSEKAIVIPCYNTVIATPTLSWPSTCRGNPKETSCTTTATALNSDETERYTRWVNSGKPAIPGCQNPIATIPFASPSPLVSTPVPSVTPTIVPASSPTPVPTTEKELYKDQHLAVRTSLASIIDFKPPEISADSKQMTVHIHLSGTITSFLDPKTQALLMEKPLFGIEVFPSTGDSAVQFTIGTVHISGFNPVAPGTKIELSSTPTPTPVATQSATPVISSPTP